MAWIFHGSFSIIGHMTDTTAQKRQTKIQTVVPDMFFILGRGRSGTSLFQTILNTHPRIAFAPEAQFVMLLFRKYRGISITDATRRRFLKDLDYEPRLKNWNLDRDALASDILELSRPDSFRALCERVYHQYALSRKKEQPFLTGDKNPHYALFGRELEKIFPDAKFIHMVRDPRDTVRSYQNVGFDARATAALAVRWSIYNEHVLALRQQTDGRFLALRFEDLLTHPESELRRVCEFLHVSYSDDLLNFHRNVEWKASWRANLHKPLDPKHIHLWKSAMPREDVEIVETICSPLMAAFGYETTTRAKNSGPLWDRLSGRWRTILEQQIYRLPPAAASGIITRFRKATRTL